MKQRRSQYLGGLSVPARVECSRRKARGPKNGLECSECSFYVAQVAVSEGLFRKNDRCLFTRGCNGKLMVHYGKPKVEPQHRAKLCGRLAP